MVLRKGIIDEKKSVPVTFLLNVGIHNRLKEIKEELGIPMGVQIKKLFEEREKNDDA